MPRAAESLETDEAGVSDLVPGALAYVALGAAASWLLQQALKRVGDVASPAFGKSGEWQGAVQPVAAMAKTGLETVFGSLARLSLGLDTVLAVATLMVLLGIWRSLLRANEIAERSLNHLAARPAAGAKAAGGAGAKGD